MSSAAIPPTPESHGADPAPFDLEVLTQPQVRALGRALLRATHEEGSPETDGPSLPLPGARPSARGERPLSDLADYFTTAFTAYLGHKPAERLAMFTLMAHAGDKLDVELVSDSADELFQAYPEPVISGLLYAFARDRWNEAPSDKLSALRSEMTPERAADIEQAIQAVYEQ